MVNILQTPFSNAFSWMKNLEFSLIFYLNLKLRSNCNKQGFVQMMAWHQTGDSPFSETTMTPFVYWRIYALPSLDWSKLFKYQSCMYTYLVVVSLTFRQLSKIFFRNLCIAEIVLQFKFQADTLYMGPKPCSGHMHKFSAWNSHHKCNFGYCIFYRDYFGEVA